LLPDEEYGAMRAGVLELYEGGRGVSRMNGMAATFLALFLAVAVAGQAAAAGLSVSIVSLPTMHRGQNASATVVTKPGARCTIKVVYKTGASKAKGLGAKTAPSNGKIKWSWKVSMNTTPGKWPVTASCQLGTASGSQKKYLWVK
jgi:hypothetical protein